VSDIISQNALRQCVNDWLAAGKAVAGPRRVSWNRVLYTAVPSANDLLLDWAEHPVNSIKEFFFPKHEKLYGYKIEGNNIELTETQDAPKEQVIVAARPCDAAALPILDHVFNWDFKDEFYNTRRTLTTIVTLACASHDDSCFCTSVGLAPDAERGSDVLLVPFPDGSYEVRCLTEKGKALFAGKTQKSDQTASVPAGPEKKVEPEKVRAFARDHFDDPFWKEKTLACFGCGMCACNCPTCHCFDIVDEGNARGGYRARNWDSCQFSLFTKHASGHNPRGSQPTRQRQRVYHKFHIYPEKFGEILCTGCGNCSRNCPAGLGVLNVASEISHG
jgi:formate hydrogenlyase subunit 6/NADH:ubiquinone oxidoreductase subunit I